MQGRDGSASPDAPQVDLADPTVHSAGRDSALWRGLRERPGLYWNVTGGDDGFWAVTRFGDVASIYRDTGAFTSTRGIRLGADLAAVESVRDSMLLVSDPPSHARLRRAFAPVFSAAAIGAVAPTLADYASLLLSSVAVDEPFDFVELVAAPYSSAALGLLLGFPRSDWSFVQGLTHAALASTNALERNAAHAELFVFASDIVAKEPSDAVRGLVSSARRAGLTTDEIVVNVHGIILAANETSRYAAAGGLDALTAHQREWNRLTGNPAYMASAVEEILRWTSPGLHVMRVATRDVKIGATLVNEGDRLALWIISANFDEQRFLAPDVFDISRAPNSHLTFGVGPHSCIGAALARVELRELFSALVRDIALCEPGGEPSRLVSNHLHGLERLPMRLRPKL